MSRGFYTNSFPTTSIVHHVKIHVLLGCLCNHDSNCVRGIAKYASFGNLFPCTSNGEGSLRHGNVPAAQSKGLQDGISMYGTHLSILMTLSIIRTTKSIICCCPTSTSSSSLSTRSFVTASEACSSSSPESSDVWTSSSTRMLLRMIATVSAVHVEDIVAIASAACAYTTPGQ